MKENPRIKPIEQATGKTWDEWLVFMDSIGAKDLDHHGIATKVLEQLIGKVDNPGWWAQSVAVTYEQYSGRRLPGQDPDGTFQTSLSRSTGLDMQALMDAWTEFAVIDKQVLGLISREPKVGGTDKRLTWRTKCHDGSTVNVISEPKANGSASVVVQLLGLPSQELSGEAKGRWTTVIERFIKQL